MSGINFGSEARSGAAPGPRLADVATAPVTPRAREAACLAILGPATGRGGVSADEAAAVLDHVAAGEWRPAPDLLSQTAEALVAAEMVTVGPEERLFATIGGQDALHCLLMAPVAPPVDAVTRVVLSLRLCLLDRLPLAERMAQADALAAACEALVAARHQEAERLATALPLLGAWTRLRRGRLEHDRDLCARVRDLVSLEPAATPAPSA